jgi:hypothetical protein
MANFFSVAWFRDVGSLDPLSTAVADAATDPAAHGRCHLESVSFDGFLPSGGNPEGIKRQFCGWRKHKSFLFIGSIAIT